MMRASLSLGAWCSDPTNLITVDAKMKKPAAFVQRISISPGLGQPSVRLQLLWFSMISVNFAFRGDLVSLSTKSGLASWSLRTSV